MNCQNSWLTLSMNTSLGCKNNVFDINASSKGQINSQVNFLAVQQFSDSVIGVVSFVGVILVLLVLSVLFYVVASGIAIVVLVVL
jgi:hypothetical protein